MESVVSSLFFLLPATSGEMSSAASKNKPRRAASSFASLTCLCLDRWFDWVKSAASTRRAELQITHKHSGFICGEANAHTAGFFFFYHAATRCVLSRFPLAHSPSLFLPLLKLLLFLCPSFHDPPTSTWPSFSGPH